MLRLRDMGWERGLNNSKVMRPTKGRVMTVQKTVAQKDLGYKTVGNGRMPGRSRPLAPAGNHIALG